jgi:tRNA-dihydrouridine synthase
LDLVAAHYEAMIVQYGPLHGPRCARKHLGWYLDQAQLPPAVAPLRQAIMTEPKPKEVLRLLALCFDEAGERAAA